MCLALVSPAADYRVDADVTTDSSWCKAPSIVGVDITEIVMHVLQVLGQTLLYFHVSQLVPVNNKVLTVNQYKIFMGTMVFLSIFNGYHWISLSFIAKDIGVDDTCLFAEYYDVTAWPAVWSIMLPIRAFYRFQCCIAFLVYFMKCSIL